MFPCAAGTKVPATPNGFHDASTDPSTIRAWWAADPDYNVAFSPLAAGVGVIDLDPGKDGVQHGVDEWETLQAIHGYVGETFTVRTPRGGLHVYVRGELPPTQHKIGPHIDTRGRGSYVLVPPSRTADGVYTTLVAAPIAPCPDWLPPLCVQRHESVKAALENQDDPANVMRAETLLAGYVKRGFVAVSGEGGNARTYAVACEVMNLGLSPQMTLEIMQEWNGECDPPWDHDALETIINNASRYAQNETGAWAVASASDTFSQVLDDLGLLNDDPVPEQRNRFKPYTWQEMKELPPPSWLLRDVLPADAVVMFYGQPGTFKSFLALDIALGVASGTETFGSVPGQQGSVAYFAAESPRSVARVRVPAWCVARGIERDLPLWLTPAVPSFADAAQVEEACKQLEAAGCIDPILVVIDTVARAMTGLDENNAKDASQFVEGAEYLRRRFPGCTVLVIHHSGKDQGRGARGSNAIQGGVDAALEVTRAGRAVEVWSRRQKDADERAAPWTYEMREMGGSVVPFPTSAKEHRQLTFVEGALSIGKVGKALAQLNAVGPERAVTTHVLASALTECEGLSEEERQAAISRTGRALTGKARDELGGYAEMNGREWVWKLPAATGD